MTYIWPWYKVCRDVHVHQTMSDFSVRPRRPSESVFILLFFSLSSLLLVFTRCLVDVCPAEEEVTPSSTDVEPASERRDLESPVSQPVIQQPEPQDPEAPSSDTDQVKLLRRFFIPWPRASCVLIGWMVISSLWSTHLILKADRWCFHPAARPRVWTVNQQLDPTATVYHNLCLSLKLQSETNTWTHERSSERRPTSNSVRDKLIVCSGLRLYEVEIMKSTQIKIQIFFNIWGEYISHW